MSRADRFKTGVSMTILRPPAPKVREAPDPASLVSVPDPRKNVKPGYRR